MKFKEVKWNDLQVGDVVVSEQPLKDSLYLILKVKRYGNCPCCPVKKVKRLYIPKMEKEWLYERWRGRNLRRVLRSKN